MKTIHYWADKFWQVKPTDDASVLIIAIQLDAWKQGMTDAANVAKGTPVVTLDEKNAILSAREDILNARNEKTSL